MLSIILMSAATQIPRLLPGLSRMSTIKSNKINKLLRSVPLAALGALIFPGILDVGDTIVTGIIAGVFSFILATKKINIMVNILVSSILTSILIYLSQLI
ncbi:AzlD domain-containing protein [Proteiniclasticum ruminis]